MAQAAASPAVRTSPNVLLRLRAMMFLQYFAQGSYLTIVAVYLKDGLKFSGSEVGWIMGAIGLGPLVAPFIVGQLVDRHLATERVLAACHLLAGIVMLGLYQQTAFGPVVTLATVYSVLYVPTMMLTNSLAFHHLADRDREFPLVRVWGTIGFIVPSWLILFYFLKGLEGEALSRAQGVAFAVSGVAGLVMAVYSLTLPHTPPDPSRSGSFAPGVVLRLARRRDFGVLFIVTFFLAMAHNYYFVFNSPLVKSVLLRVNEADWVQTFTTLGQVAEIGVMAALGPALLKLGYKRTMLIGAASYALRCIALAVAGDAAIPFGLAASLAAVGQVLHGVCFGFFLAAAFIYVDRASPPDVKGSMQTIFGTFVFGIGGVLGAVLGGQMDEWFVTGEGASAVYQWNPIWLSCAALAGVFALVLAVGFPKQWPDATS